MGTGSTNKLRSIWGSIMNKVGLMWGHGQGASITVTFLIESTMDDPTRTVLVHFITNSLFEESSFQQDKRKTTKHGALSVKQCGI